MNKMSTRYVTATGALVLQAPEIRVYTKDFRVSNIPDIITANLNIPTNTIATVSYQGGPDVSSLVYPLVHIFKVSCFVIVKVLQFQIKSLSGPVNPFRRLDIIPAGGITDPPSYLVESPAVLDPNPGNQPFTFIVRPDGSMSMNWTNNVGSVPVGLLGDFCFSYVIA